MFSGFDQFRDGDGDLSSREWVVDGSEGIGEFRGESVVEEDRNEGWFRSFRRGETTIGRR